MTLLSKAVFNGGMKTSVFVFYRQLIGAIVMVPPLALIFERKQAVPVTFSFMTIFKIFMLSLLGITLTLNVHGIALSYTSAMLAAAIVNCLPASTFFFAVLLRVEKVNIRTKSGISKIGSVLLCMAGVAILAFYKGPQLQVYHLLSRYHHNNQQHEDHFSYNKKWILGSLLLFLATIMWSLWLVLQAQLLKSYPSKLTFMSIQSLSSAIQSFFIAIAFERDIEQWKLGWNMRLLAVVYAAKNIGHGTLVTAVAYYLQALVIDNVLGGILLVLSLYTVLWAKSKDTHQNSLPIQAYKECADQVKTDVACSKSPQ
ncbi:WAT1-related protein [Trifolium repens]|nr:WAT1-related protein [Trifolium repens]